LIIYFFVDISKMVNCHCGKRTVYNVNGEKALYCSAHKEPNMINVTTKKM